MMKIQKTIDKKLMNRAQLCESVLELDSSAVVDTRREQDSALFQVTVECSDEASHDINSFLDSFKASEDEETTCRKCNNKKQAKALIEFLKEATPEEKAELKDLIK